MFKCGINIHLKDFGDVFPLVFNGEGFTVETFSFAHFTLHPDIGEQPHIDLFRTVTVTRFTSTPGDVETEPSGFIASQFRIGQTRIECANIVEDLRIRCCIGTRCSSDRCHVNVNNFINDIGDWKIFAFNDTPNIVVIPRHCLCFHKVAGECTVENIANQGTFPGTANTRHTAERTHRYFRADPFEIVLARVADLHPPVSCRTAGFRLNDHLITPEILGSECIALLHELCRCTDIRYLSTFNAGTGTEINYPISHQHSRLIVFNDDNGITLIPQV